MIQPNRPTKKEHFESKIESLITAHQVTVDPATQRELGRRINALNLKYQQYYGVPYRPKVVQDAGRLA